MLPSYDVFKSDGASLWHTANRSELLRFASTWNNTKATLALGFQLKLIMVGLLSAAGLDNLNFMFCLAKTSQSSANSILSSHSRLSTRWQFNNIFKNKMVLWLLIELNQECWIILWGPILFTIRRHPRDIIFNIGIFSLTFNFCVSHSWDEPAGCACVCVCLCVWVWVWMLASFL